MNLQAGSERKTKLVAELLSLNAEAFKREKLEKKKQQELENQKREEEKERGREAARELILGLPVKLRDAARAGQKTAIVYKNNDISANTKRGLEEELARFCRKEGLRFRVKKPKYQITISWKKKVAPKRRYNDYWN